MMNFRQFRIKLYLIACFIVISSQATAVIIDLNTFTADPSGNVSVTADGLSATFTEDLFISPISLSHSGYSIPSDSTFLTFDYSLSVAAYNEDYFDFYLSDLTTPLYSVGGFTDLYSDTLSFDVSAFAGSLLPMNFSFSYGWDDWGLDSSLTISNLEITQASISVSEPGSLLLLLSGILGIVFRFRRK